MGTFPEMTPFSRARFIRERAPLPAIQRMQRAPGLPRTTQGFSPSRLVTLGRSSFRIYQPPERSSLCRRDIGLAFRLPPRSLICMFARLFSCQLLLPAADLLCFESCRCPGGAFKSDETPATNSPPFFSPRKKAAPRNAGMPRLRSS